MKKIWLVLALSLAGCGTTKGYHGSVESEERLAIISSSNYIKMGVPSRYEALSLLRVNDVQVGSSSGGYPREVNVRAGHNVITLEYKHNLNQSIFGAAASSGAIGGVLAAMSDRYANSNEITLDLDLKPGSRYRIMFYPAMKSKIKEVPRPWVVDVETREVIYGSVPSAVSDPLKID